MQLIKNNWLIVVAIIIVSLSMRRTKEIEKPVDRPIVKEVKIDSTFTPEKFMLYLKELGIRHADIVYAQAVLETGNFKSKSFRVYNNLFGMRVAKSRPTTALGEKFGYAYFKNWQMSVIDYALFQSAYARKIRSKDCYYEYLSRNYASDAEYVNKLKNIIAKL